MSSLPDDTLIAALAHSAAHHPDRVAVLHNSRCKPVEIRSYADVLDKALRTAARLRALGVERGDRVVLALPTGWDWFDVWLGAVCLGALPVAVSPGFALGSASYQRQKIFGIADQFEARLLIGGAHLGADADATPRDTIVATPDTLDRITDAEPVTPHRPAPGDTAYLQLTSGSTGRPKGVEVTHRGILHNIGAIHTALAARNGVAPKTGVFWLPLFHDFGLIMSIGSMLRGLDLYLYPPNAFLSRPAEWLRQLAQKPGVLSAGPNFALGHMASKIAGEVRDALDLSCWSTSIIGAEMNRIDTMRRFTGSFGASGLSPATLTPAYGMAETTLVITMDQSGNGLRTAMSNADAQGDRAEVVTCGAPIADTEIRIVGPGGTPLPDREVGAVQVRGPGLMNGYFQDPDATAAAFDGDWFITGDLGFMLDGELYVTGRQKDVLIVNGVNIMPHELERLAEGQTGGGGMARAAAISLDRGEGGETPVLVIELDRKAQAEELAKMEHAIKGRISQELGITLGEVMFAPRGAIPRTTSGKLQRAELRRAVADGTVPRLTED